MDPARLNDQLLPQNATDGFAPNFDFWPHKGTAEWVAYEFAQPTTVELVTVSWFDDTGTGECRLPVSWRLLYRGDDGQWKPVASAFGLRHPQTRPGESHFHSRHHQGAAAGNPVARGFLRRPLRVVGRLNETADRVRDGNDGAICV